MDVDPAVVEMVFWRICRADFPDHVEELRPLLKATQQLLEGTLPRGQRELDRLCAQFMAAHAVRWPRYEAWVREQGREPRLEYDEDADEGPDYREMGELLAHRVVMAYYGESRRRRLMDNVADMPVWQLVAIEDGRTPAQCLAEATRVHHWQSSYWREKKIPCERLFCRCRIKALTIKEAGAFIVADAPPP